MAAPAAAAAAGASTSGGASAGGASAAQSFGSAAGMGIGSGLIGLIASKYQSDLQRGAQDNYNSWQERMSNTAYQRATADMRAAGLNPGLMYGSGDSAAIPSGGVAPAPQLQGLAGEMSSSALSALSTMQQVAKTNSEIANLDAGAQAGLANATKATADAGNASTAKTLMEAQARQAKALAESAELDRYLKKQLKDLAEQVTGKSPGRDIGQKINSTAKTLMDYKPDPRSDGTIGDDIKAVFSR